MDALTDWREPSRIQSQPIAGHHHQDQNLLSGSCFHNFRSQIMMAMFSRIHLAIGVLIALTLIILYWSLPAGSSGDLQPIYADQQPSATRVSAIADLHGDLDQSLSALRLAGELHRSTG